jgi:hypothetical protein
MCLLLSEPLNQNQMITHKWYASDKHSSLLRWGYDCSRKKFLSIGPGSQWLMMVVKWADSNQINKNQKVKWTLIRCCHALAIQKLS